MEITNQWPYSDVVNITPILPKIQYQDATLTTGGNELFSIITLKKNRKAETLKFSSEYRNEILCLTLLYRSFFSEMCPKIDIIRYNCVKRSWSDKKTPIILEINVSSVNQIDPLNGQVITSYLFKDIDDLIIVSDYPQGFVISTSGFGRYHLFSSPNNDRDDLLKKIREYAWLHAGCVIRIKKDAITYDHFQSNRFGKFSNDEAITSLYEFTVHKISSKDKKESIRRILALTDSCLVERDPDTYSIVTLKSLNDIFALIRSPVNPQLFHIEFVKGQTNYYTSIDRDSLLASLLDGVRASGNTSVHVKMTPTERGYRIGPYIVPVDEEVESWHLKFLQTTPIHWTFNDAVLRFNCNCAYAGLLHSVTQDGLFAENKEKMIQAALGAFVEKEGDQDDIQNEHLEQQFLALRRLVASKAGFAAFTLSPRFRESLGLKVVKALKRNNDAVTHAAIDMLCALMQVIFKTIFESSDLTLITL
jgi:hypothetical protein